MRRRYLWLLLCGALLAPPVLADKPAAETAGPDAQKQALSNELDQFVRDAINEGLLAPSGTSAPASGETAADPVSVPSNSLAAAAPSDAWAAAGPMDCSAPYPLDFSEFEASASYSDILNYRSQLLAEGSKTSDNPRLARAYLALDMGSEAMMNLGAPDNPEEQALRQLALLLDGRTRPDVAYFQELARCHEAASFWLGMALLMDGQGTGAAHVDKGFNAFRHLPLQLRTSITAMAVPALDRTDGRFLSQKMLASFSKDQLHDSAQLQFANAILELGQGSTEAEILIRTFLLQGRFQEEALFALIRHKRVIDAPLRSLLLDGMLVRLEQSQRDEDIRASMRFVLEELGAESRYVTMLEMAGQENMQSDTVQEEIRNHLAAGLQRDLASDDPLRNLAAIEALSIETGLLDHHDQRTALYEAGTLKAVRLGFASLADELSRKTQPGETIAEQRATLAYRLKDYPAVFQIAETNPANPQIAFMAAMSAIDANKPAQLERFVSGLELDDVTTLALIEQDAVKRHWIVPGRVYDAARQIKDESLQARANRVLTLKQSAGGAITPPPAANMTGMSDRLMSTRMALETLEEGSN